MQQLLKLCSTLVLGVGAIYLGIFIIDTYFNHQVHLQTQKAQQSHLDFKKDLRGAEEN